MLEDGKFRELVSWFLTEMIGPSLGGLWLFVGLLGILLLWAFRLVTQPRNAISSIAVAGVSFILTCLLVWAVYDALVQKSISIGRSWIWLQTVAQYTIGTALGIASACVVFVISRRSPLVATASIFVLLSLPVFLLYQGLQDGDVFHEVEAIEDGAWVLPDAPDSPDDIVSAPAEIVDGMVLVPAGTFIHGSMDKRQKDFLIGSWEGDERPIVTRYVSAFYIDRYEVTNDEFAEFVRSENYVTMAEEDDQVGRRWGPEGWIAGEGLDWREPFFKGDSNEDRGNHPVVQVTWYDAGAYCASREARLPTEVEWEKAARGPWGWKYPWGNVFAPDKTNYCDTNCTQLPQHKDNEYDDGYQYTAPVGTYPQGVSYFGVHDMAGNVWEWVNDRYDPFYYYYAPLADPPGPEKRRLTTRLVRGGSYAAAAGYLRTTSRSFDPPNESYFGVGFRCARTAPDD